MSKKLEDAIQYLRERNIYRGDTNCQHRYSPYEASQKDYYTIVVTVPCKTDNTVAHIGKKSDGVQLSRS